MRVYEDEFDFLARDRTRYPERAVLAFTRKELGLLREMKPGGGSDRPLLGGYTQVTRWPDMVLAGPILGAPQAAMVMEILARRGVRDFLSLGWCGSMTESLKWGDIVLPDSAVAEEGTSAHYPGPAEAPRPSRELSEKLAGGLQADNLSFTAGTVWTTDAPYRETRTKVRDLAGRGVLAVDMETSALLAVARFRGLEWAGLLVVSDELWSDDWRPGFRSEVLTRGLTAAAGVILKVFS